MNPYSEYETIGKPWSSGLFDCLQDLSTCTFGSMCCCILYGQNVATTRGGGRCGASCLYCCCDCIKCFFAGNHRGDLRRKYNLSEEPCNDCLTHLFFSTCAVCQEAREHKKNGTQV